MSSDVVYRSRVQVERLKGPYRRVQMPAESDPVYFSVHSEIADFYNVPPGRVPNHATTLDYLVAAAAG